jgi:NTE family protein
MPDTKLAVILAGAVAKGAFEAGALEVLVERLPADTQIVSLVGASSGALNATVLASGIHAGKAREMTRTLSTLWQSEGGLGHIFHPSPANLIARRGISDQKRLRALLEEHVTPARTKQRLALKFILSPLSGRQLSGSHHDATCGAGTTYEAALRFSNRDFETADGLRRVFDAAVASAAFPVLFAPADADQGGQLGPCIDGGVVNNTPIKYAVEAGDVATVVIIAPTVAVVQPNEFDDVHGFDLVGHVSDMLINERLHRDLLSACETNRQLDALDALVTSGTLGADQLGAVKVALGIEKRRVLKLVNIRPSSPLPGNAFSGFLHRAQRNEYLAIGRQRAGEVLDGLGWRGASVS